MRSGSLLLAQHFFCEIISLTSQSLRHFPAASSRMLKKITSRKIKHDCFSSSLLTSTPFHFPTPFNPFATRIGEHWLALQFPWLSLASKGIESPSGRSLSFRFEMRCLDFGSKRSFHIFCNFSSVKSEHRWLGVLTHDYKFGNKQCTG